MSYARTAFVFAGGSSLGAAHVDMSRELMHAGSAPILSCASNSQQARQLTQIGNSMVRPVAQHFGVGP